MFENFPISKNLFMPRGNIICIAASQTSNLNNSANLEKIVKIFLVVYQGPRWSLKKGGEKSRDSVPLNNSFLQ
jgi:hypothetical protein